MLILGKTWKVAAVLLCATACVLGVASADEEGKAGPLAEASRKKQKPEPGAEIFDNKHVLSVRIEVSKSEFRVLQSNDKRFARADFYEGTNVWREVGLRIKGAAGSRRGMEDKPALTVAFGHFVPEQRFHGLRKIHLNNSVQDPSYMTENLCGELFRKAGVPAARVTFATVEINRQKKGFYVVKEGFAKEMLGMYFKNTKGNLYDGGFLHDINEHLDRGSAGEEDVKDWSDLKALTAASREPDAGKRWEDLNKVLDVDRFLSFAALEVMTWDWDGYLLNHNNYRVYHDLDTGKMVFFPHGMDQMFSEPARQILPQDRIDSSIVGRAVLRCPQGLALYRERFAVLFTNVFKIETLTNRVTELAALILPELVKLDGPGAGREFEGQASHLRRMISLRHQSLSSQLGEREPEPQAFRNGVAKITNWEPPVGLAEQGGFIRNKEMVDGRRTLHIASAGRGSASWRTRLTLNTGLYQFEAMAKTRGVAPLGNPAKGEGAGIRLSGVQKARDNKIVGDSDWRKLSYPFSIENTGTQITLVCELLAERGDVWFDLDSMKLMKVR